LKPFIVGAK